MPARVSSFVASKLINIFVVFMFHFWYQLSSFGSTHLAEIACNRVGILLIMAAIKSIPVAVPDIASLFLLILASFPSAFITHLAAIIQFARSFHPTLSIPSVANSILQVLGLRNAAKALSIAATTFFDTLQNTNDHTPPRILSAIMGGPNRFNAATPVPTRPKCPVTSWALDSGAMIHVTCHRHVYSTFQSFDPPRNMNGIAGSLLVAGTGLVKIMLRSSQILELKNVWFTPNGRTNVISTSRLAQEHNLSLIFQHNSCFGVSFVREEDGDGVTKPILDLHGSSRNGDGLYWLNMRCVVVISHITDQSQVRDDANLQVAVRRDPLAQRLKNMKLFLVGADKNRTKYDYNLETFQFFYSGKGTEGAQVVWDPLEAFAIEHMGWDPEVYEFCTIIGDRQVGDVQTFIPAVTDMLLAGEPEEIWYMEPRTIITRESTVDETETGSIVSAGASTPSKKRRLEGPSETRQGCQGQ